MSDDDTRQGERQTLVGSDLIIPCASIALTIYFFSTILDSPWTAKVTALFVGVILIALSVLYIVKSLLIVRSGVGRWTFADLIEPIGMLPQRLSLLGLTIASLIVMPWIGFTLTSMLFLTCATLLLTNGHNPARIITLAVSLSIFWFIVFVLIFQRRFPVAWLDEQIKAIVSPALKAMGLD